MMTFNSYTDPDGNPLGHWETVSREEYWRIYDKHRGIAVIFSEMTPRSAGVDREVHTEWGMRGEKVPLIGSLWSGPDSCSQANPNDMTYARFVLAGTESTKEPAP